MIVLNSVDPCRPETACLRLGLAPRWLKESMKSSHLRRHLSRRASSPTIEVAEMRLTSRYAK